VLLLALAAGCETTQPLQIDEETYELQLLCDPNDRLPAYDVWAMTEDGVPEVVYLFCESAGEFEVESIPWNFSIEVEILRAGATAPEEVTTSDALDPLTNLTKYDWSEPVYGVTPSKSPITIDDGGNLRTFSFEPIARFSAANELVMMSISNPLSDFDPNTYGLGDGLCSNHYPGPAGIDGMAQPVSLQIRKGDTLIVQARKDVDHPQGFNYLGDNQPLIEGQLLLDGQEVTVRGENRSSLDPGAGFSFSFTAL
jgi:hypothetical protein